MKKKLIFVLALLLSYVSTCRAVCGAYQDISSDEPLSISVINDDMALASEGKPYGVPRSYDWFDRGVLHLSTSVPAGFTSITGWGQIFKVEGNLGEEGSKVIVSNLVLAVRSKTTDLWRVLQWTGDLSGGAFRPDYKYNSAEKADIRRGAGGMTEFVLRSHPNIHFFPIGARPSIDGEDLADVVVAIRARVVRDDSERSAGADEPKILLGAGADYWKSVDAIWDQWKTNKGIGVGRMKLVRERWSWFTFSTTNNSARLGSLLRSIKNGNSDLTKHVCIDG